MQPPRGKPANLANSAKPAQTPTPLPIADETSTASPDAPTVVTQPVNAPTGPRYSAANSCLYGICHAAILSAGYSPALGFIHTGKQLSFVYDVADLYKAELTIPAAFAAVAEDGPGLESRVRHKCRDLFHEQRLLARIVGDLQFVLNGDPNAEQTDEASDDDFAADEAAPGGLWDPDQGVVPGGVDHSPDPSAAEGQAEI